MRHEIYGATQKGLIHLSLNRLKELNSNILRYERMYNEWDRVTDERILRYGRDGFKHAFLDHARRERENELIKLRQIRNGYTYD